MYLLEMLDQLKREKAGISLLKFLVYLNGSLTFIDVSIDYWYEITTPR